MNYPKILAVLLLINTGGQSCAIDSGPKSFWGTYYRPLLAVGVCFAAFKLFSMIRDYKTAHYGHYGMLGRHSPMEDFTNTSSQDGVEAHILCDGHAGPYVAKHAAAILPKTIFKKIRSGQDIASALVNSYVEVDADLEKNNIPCDVLGTTAVTALVLKNEIVVANAGDSRAVLCCGEQVKALSHDHKPDREDERSRIQKAGGRVMHRVGGHALRVEGELAVSRAIGDHYLSPYVIPTPDIERHTRSPKDEFLILASDGVWDVMTNESAVRCVKNKLDSGASARKAAEELAKRAYELASMDNISAIVVKLQAKRA